MCFEMIHRVDTLEKADFTMPFTITKPPTLDKDFLEKMRREAPTFIQTAARIALENELIRRVLEEAEKYPNHAYLNPGALIDPSADRQVVIEALGGSYFKHPDTHYDPTFVTRDHRMKDKIVTLVLKDFCFLAEYALVVTPQDKVEKDVLLAIELRANYNVDSAVGKVYEFRLLDLLSHT